jgi:hypothetical protein
VAVTASRGLGIILRHCRDHLSAPPEHPGQNSTERLSVRAEAAICWRRKDLMQITGGLGTRRPRLVSSRMHLNASHAKLMLRACEISTCLFELFTFCSTDG